MAVSVLRERLNQHFSGDRCDISGDGYHFRALILSQKFKDMTKVKRQQMVYALITDLIQSGLVHAIELQTFTEEEWLEKNG